MGNVFFLMRYVFRSVRLAVVLGAILGFCFFAVAGLGSGSVALIMGAIGAVGGIISGLILGIVNGLVLGCLTLVLQGEWLAPGDYRTVVSLAAVVVTALLSQSILYNVIACWQDCSPTDGDWTSITIGVFLACAAAVVASWRVSSWYLENREFSQAAPGVPE